MNQNIDQLKQEISEYYLKDFKEELGWLKSIALLPIEKKIKSLISGKTELPQKFDEIKEFWRWKDIINFVSPKTANQIFEFMKQKRIEIQKRQTKEELESLKKSILGIPSNEPEKQQGNNSTQTTPLSNTTEQQTENKTQKEKEEVNSASIGASVGTIGATGVYTLNKLNQSQEIKKMAKNINAETMKNTINKAIWVLEKQKTILWSSQGANRLSTKEIQTIDKHIKKLTDGLENINNEGIDLIKTWKSLDGKLPKKLLESAALDPKTLSKIEALGEEIIGKNTDEITTILKQHNITSLDKELIESLSKAKSPTELKGMTKVLRHGNKANRILQTLSGAMVIDVACLGLDIWVYLETQKEAELIAKVNETRAKNKKNQAYTQLTIGVASLVAEAAIIGYAVTMGTAVGGPFGTVVGLAVGGVSAAASMGVDSLYFDVEDFYTQNQEDFLRQSRGKLKHTILQGIHNKKEGNISLNEKIHASTARLFSAQGKNSKEESLKEACFSMLFLEEIEIWDFENDSDLLTYIHSGKSKSEFINTLPEKERAWFEKKRDEITKKINHRLEYIEAEFQKPDIIKAIKNNQGVKALTTLFTASNLYAYQGKEKWKAELSYKENLEKSKSEFFADFPAEKLKKFEMIKTSNPRLFAEILTTGSLDSLYEEDSTNQNYNQNVKLLDTYQKWIKLTQSYEELSMLEIQDSHRNTKFVEEILKADFDLDKVEYPTIKKENITTIIENKQERRGITDISDDPMQNILYQLAKELYGYSGKNDWEELMNFFSQDAEVHGFYYDNKRKLNEERAIDQGVDSLNLSEYSIKEIPQMVENFFSKEFNSNKSFGFSLPKILGFSAPIFLPIILGMYHEKSIIDTPTESIDENLQNEWKSKIKELLTKELTHRSKENKEKVKNQISTFVQKHAKDWNYIELPYYLLIAARQAGFWDLQRQFFSRKNDKLQILSMQTELENSNNLSAERSYFTNSREKFTQQELRYINRIETAHQRLEKLRDKTGKNIFGVEGVEDDLDLPKEVEILISNKYKEREKFKAELLLRDASIAIDIWTINQYEAFIDYFEHLYQGILLSLLDFKISNDMDGFSYYQSALAQWAHSLFDEKWELKEGESWILSNKAFRKWYNKHIQIFKVNNKSIQQLWQSKNTTERELALQASQVMLRNFLEVGLFKYNTKWEIESINSGNINPSIEKVNKKIETELWSLSWVPQLINAQYEIQKLQKPITIKTLQNHESQTLDYAKILQKQIEQTQEDIVWQGKRGKITYLPEESALQSRGNKVEFKKEKNWFKLKDLELTLSIQELCRLANFRNRCVHKYKGEKISFETEIWSKTIAFLPTFVINWTVLLDRSNLNTYCPVCKSDTAMKKITNWLNSQL